MSYPEKFFSTTRIDPFSAHFDGDGLAIEILVRAKFIASSDLRNIVLLSKRQFNGIVGFSSSLTDSVPIYRITYLHFFRPVTTERGFAPVSSPNTRDCGLSKNKKYRRYENLLFCEIW